MIRIGSLCTGYGGLDEAVRQVFGGSVAWHCQYDPDDSHQYATQILAHHWPDIPNHGDITKVDFTKVEPVDLLTAGFPCQDVSLAGLRAGIAEGTRSGLWRHVARAIAELQPRLVVIENVPGLLSSPAHSDVEPCPWCLGDPEGEPPLRALGAVLGDLARLGLDAEWTSLAASDAVDACHQRRRVFVLAWFADAESAGRPWQGIRGRAAERPATAAHADSVGGERHRTGGQPTQRHAAGTDRPAAHAAGVGEREPANQAHAVAGGGDARQVSGGRGGTPAAHADCGRLERHQELSDRRNPLRQRVREDADGCDDAPADTKGDGRNQGRPEPTGVQRRSDTAERGGTGVEWGPYEAAIRRWEHVLGRPAPRPTDALGRLAPPFVEWMQGLPAGHVTAVPGLPRGAQLKALGNGVMPQQAEAALRLLLDRIAHETVAS